MTNLHLEYIKTFPSSIVTNKQTKAKTIPFKKWAKSLRAISRKLINININNH